MPTEKLLGTVNKSNPESVCQSRIAGQHNGSLTLSGKMEWGAKIMVSGGNVLATPTFYELREVTVKNDRHLSRHFIS